MVEENRYEIIQKKLMETPKAWLVTGVAGFIGSNILEKLLKLNQIVIGLDNFSTGFKRNLDEVKNNVNSIQWARFKLIEGDICEYSSCQNAIKNIDYVLHQAALGSVPRSINNPLKTNIVNITGFLNMLEAAKNENVKSFTFAASSSTYGDHPSLPKIEENIGNPLSPYAVTKYVNELYAKVYASTYGFKSIGLRYFNVFGPRQNPNGEYAAVIPKWTYSMLNRKSIFINGDGETSRDFCYVENIVQMNILAATAKDKVKNEIYNVALGDRTTLNELFRLIKNALKQNGKNIELEPKYSDFRSGDVRHSQAQITKAQKFLGYKPTHDIERGIIDAIPWYIEFLKNEK